MTHQDQKPSDIVPPDLYDQEYYLSDNEGFLEFKQGLDGNIHDKFKRVLRLIDIKESQKILDIGCGRGEMVYYAAAKGAKVLGLDYSSSAVALAGEVIKSLPPQRRENVRLA